MTQGVESQRIRVTFLAAIITALTVILTALIFLAGDEIFWSNWTINATAAMSVVAGLRLLRSRKVSLVEKRVYVILVGGLSLWLAAELLWTYYELGLGIETPYPSAADALWLIGYGPFIYYVYSKYRRASSELPERRLITVFLTTIIIISIIAIFLFPIVDSTLNGSNNLTELAIGVSYPVLDAVLLTLAIMTFVNIRLDAREYYPFVSSLLILVAMVAFVIADTGFGYEAAMDTEQLQEHDQAWNSLYNLGYISIAGALFLEYRLRRSKRAAR
jgi:diguanylate cyclase